MSIREEVEIAHRHVQQAQKEAYRYNPKTGKAMATWRVRIMLNRAQNTLIKLLVHHLKGR